MKKKILSLLVALGIVGGGALGARTVVPLWNANELNVEVSASSFADATTTPIAILNPFSATSTIDWLIFDITGVSTSTIDITCGTSTTAYATPSDTLLDDVTVSTSTYAYLRNGCTGHECLVSAGTNSKNRIEVYPNEYVVCNIGNDGGLGSTDGVTNAANTFDGNYSIRWVTNN